MLAQLELAPFFAALGGPQAPAEPAAEPEIRRLVQAACAGDAGARSELYRQHVGAVFRAVRALSRDEAEAEDVVQEAFVKALVKLPRYQPREGTRFLGWLLAIALNEARRRRRWWRRAVLQAEPLEAPSDEVDPGERLDAARRRALLLTALAELPEREREVISLRYGADASAAEVAQAMGLGEANVRKICERQRQRLLARLEELEGSAP